MITAVIPIFNTRPDHLFECVYSLINQIGVEPFPILLANDGSTDWQSIRAMRLLHENTEGRVVMINDGCQPNRGTPTILNEVQELVKTPYILIQGSQDISDRTRVLRQLNYIKNNPRTDVLGTGLFMFKDTDIERKSIGTAVHKEHPTTKDRKGNPYWLVNHGTVIYRKSAVDAVGGYDPAFLRGQDIDLWRRMLDDKAVFRNLPDILYAWRR